MIHNPRLRGRGLQRMRRSIMAAEPLCRLCKAAGRTTLAAELDHIVPVHKGGTNERANLQPLCPECHAAKTYADTHGRPRPQPIRAKDW